MNDVAPIDISDLPRFFSPILVCKNIKPIKEEMSMYRCRFLYLSDIGRGKSVFLLLVSSS